MARSVYTLSARERSSMAAALSPEERESIAAAANIMKVSVASVYDARFVAQRGIPTLGAAVLAGTVDLEDAVAIARLRKESQAERLAHVIGVEARLAPEGESAQLGLFVAAARGAKERG